MHEPFCLKKYRRFVKSQQKKWNTNKTIFIGDLIDSHYSSYHETDPDGLSGGDELEQSIKRIAKWYKDFPKATVIIGNHDRIVMRKAKTGNIPKAWIKSYKEVLKVPGWDFVERIEIDDVQYIHGEGGVANTKAQSDMMSTVQGHLHTKCSTTHLVGKKYRIFATQTGCGIDHDSYAMSYCKYGRKPAIGCVVVLDSGQLPINCLMPL